MEAILVTIYFPADFRNRFPIVTIINSGGSKGGPLIFMSATKVTRAA